MLLFRYFQSGKDPKEGDAAREEEEELQQLFVGMETGNVIDFKEFMWLMCVCSLVARRPLCAHLGD